VARLVGMTPGSEAWLALEPGAPGAGEVLHLPA
jgi:hypothetical protein